MPRCAVLSLILAGLAFSAGAAPNAPAPQTVEPASLKTYVSLQVTEDIFYPGASGRRTFHHKARVLAARENQFRIETLDSPGDPYVGSVTVCDGKIETVYDSKAKTVTRYPFRLQAGYDPVSEITAGYFPFKAEAAALDGHPTLYARLDGSTHDKSPIRMEWWFDTQTKLPVRHIDYRTVDGNLREVYRKNYSEWLVNQPLPPSAFTFTPPAGTKETPGQA